MTSKKVPDAVMAELAAVPGRLVSAWAAHDAEALELLLSIDVYRPHTEGNGG